MGSVEIGFPDADEVNSLWPNPQFLIALHSPNALLETGLRGGEGGIRTLGTGVSPYNGLANRRIRPLCHLSGVRSYILPCRDHGHEVEVDRTGLISPKGVRSLWFLLSNCPTE